MLQIDKLIDYCKKAVRGTPKNWDGTYLMLLRHMGTHREVAIRLLSLKRYIKSKVRW